jgi:serine/threonine-protein kinase
MGKSIDQRSDVFSLGVMLYEMLTGQTPFQGENVNAIMYQTLNAIPAAPNTLNPVVPEMINFIVAKALAKGVDDRYQNAKDLAIDLKACRDTLPRSSQPMDIFNPSTGAEKQSLQAIGIGGRMDEDDKPVSTVGLSPAFDSAAATMRLAAWTASSEDVNELSKTLNIPRPTDEEIRQAAPLQRAARPAVRQSRGVSEQPHTDGGLLLLAVVIVVLLGLVSIFAS